MLDLLGFLRFYRGYRAKREAENLSQAQLLREEFKLLGAAVLVIVVMFGAMIGLYWWLSK